jgi:hypothetical protein
MNDWRVIFATDSDCHANQTLCQRKSQAIPAAGLRMIDFPDQFYIKK